MRSGILARKLGMSRVFRGDGKQIPVTLLALEGCRVVGRRDQGLDGYTALQVGAGTSKAKSVAKPQRLECAARNIEPCVMTREFRVENEMMLEVGAQFSADHFVVGQKVDISGTSKGHGFTGAMKRWGFGGLRATHGVSVSHRSHGSTGQCQDPGKVFKGKKMAGHHGGTRQTVQNLEIVETDPDRGLIFVHGAVAGARNSWVEVRDAVKSARPEAAPLPAGLLKPAEAAPLPEAPAIEADDGKGSEQE